jgi:hypothetical protein
MREPSAANVLGDFAGARFSHNGVTTTFSTRDGRYFVETDGTDGKLHEYEIRYTVGIRPLQQYLVRRPTGAFIPRRRLGYKVKMVSSLSRSDVAAGAACTDRHLQIGRLAAPRATDRFREELRPAATHL